MAYINSSKGTHKSLYVDLTPMVDLGFLLISFFVFTTTVMQPVSLGIVMPDDKPVSRPSLLQEKDAIHLVLTDAEHIYLYYGSNPADGFMTNYAPQGLRTLFANYKVTQCTAPGSFEKNVYS